MGLIKLLSTLNNRIKVQQGDIQIQGGATLLPKYKSINGDRFATWNLSFNDKFLQECEDRKGKVVATARPERGKEECY
jgi:hypothetical protein